MISYTKNELVAELSGKLGITAVTANKFTDEFIACLTRALLRTEKVTFRDFGLFEIKVSKSKIGRNPKKPADTYRIPPKRVVKFRAGRELDAALNVAQV